MDQRARGRWIRTAALAALLSLAAAPFVPHWLEPADPPSAQPPTLFAHWPTDRKPDVVLVLSGQTHGYLSPCGCSRPQKGGLERRANLMAKLREKGWPVVGLDLGDIAAAPKVHEQELLKYKKAMEALREMGYAAVGVGEYDFKQQLFELLGEFTLQNLKDPRPVVLAANLSGKNNGAVVPRTEFFTSGKDTPPLVEDVEVVVKDPKGGPCLPFGVAGVVGRSVYEKVAKIEPNFAFTDNGDSLKACLDKIKTHTAKPDLNVLLYNGKLDEAQKVAEKFPAFQVMLCQIEESEPPSFPSYANDNKTFIIQVGHKGQNVGVVGVFKSDKGIELFYQLVPLGEEFLTPKNQEKDHRVLGILDDYSKQVKDRNLLAKYVEKQQPHPAMIQNPNAKLTYVGVEKCKTCHPNEAKIWGGSKHSHAYEALEKLAYNPGNRQFDGDCVSCHSIGFDYKSGFQNETATPNLKHNGCENCHGPGSGHAADPKDKVLLAALKPWKRNADDKLPSKETLEALAKLKPGEQPAKPLTPQEQMTWNAVSTMCMRCHDSENDPKFDFNVNMPKIWHSGFKAAAGAGLPVNAK